MADQMLEHVRELAEGQIDFEGQKLSELLATALLIAIGSIAFIVGYVLQDITLSLYIGLGGTALAFIVIVPPWPFYNGHPVKWLPVVGSEAAPQGITVDGKVVA